MALILAGCGGGGGISPSGPTDATQPGWTVRSVTGTQPARKWTFLVFLNAANDLETEGDLNLGQMEQVGSTSDVNIVVQVKRDGGAYDPTVGTWGDTRRYYMRKNATGAPLLASSTLLSQNSGVDMGTAQALKDFVQWGTQAYPAQHYALVIWSHGDGWRAAHAHRYAPTRGVSYDYTTGHHIPVTQLAGAVTFGQKWDVIAFDACLMNMLESAYEVRNQTQYIDGSEDLTPGDGYPYNAILGDLTANPSWAGRDLAADIAKQMFTAYPNIWSPGADDVTVTQSALDASKLDAVTAAVDNLASVLLTKTAANGTYQSEMGSVRRYTQPFEVSYPAPSAPPYTSDEDVYDVVDFARLLSQPSASDISYGFALTQDADIQAAAQQVQSAVRAATISNYSDAWYKHANGIAIYLPNATDYRTDDLTQQATAGNVRYSDLDFAKAAPHWTTLIQQMP